MAPVEHKCIAPQVDFGKFHSYAGRSYHACDDQAPHAGGRRGDFRRRSGALNDAEFAQIEQAWNRHGALLFRDQKLTDDDLLAFSRRFGELDPPPIQEHGRQSPEGYPDIYVVSNVLDDKGAPIGALGAGEAVWHTDMSYLRLPPDASMLYSLEVPPTGGNTWVLGMQAAWSTLPEALKAKVRGRRIKHDGTYNSGGYLRKGVTPTDDPHKAPGAWHPAVLAIRRRARRCSISGGGAIPMWRASRRRSPMRCSTRCGRTSSAPDLRYEHRWRVGDLLLWDNRSTMHRRDPFDNATRRVMHRTQIKGKGAPRASGAKAALIQRPPEPRHRDRHREQHQPEQRRARRSAGPRASRPSA